MEKHVDRRTITGKRLAGMRIGVRFRTGYCGFEQVTEPATVREIPRHKNVLDIVPIWNQLQCGLRIHLRCFQIWSIAIKVCPPPVV